MISIILATEAGCGHGLFEVLGSFGTLRQDSPERMTAEDGHRWLMLMQSDDIAEDYESDDLARVHHILRNPEFFILQARNFKSIADFIMRIPDEKTVVIDNDYGWIDLPQSYKASIAKGQDWMYFSGGPQ